MKMTRKLCWITSWDEKKLKSKPMVASVLTMEFFLFKQPPFIMKSKNNDSQYIGYCIDLINLIADDMQFNYTIYEPFDGQYGAVNDSNQWSGMIGELVAGVKFFLYIIYWLQ